jgi:hypothetical protein
VAAVRATDPWGQPIHYRLKQGQAVIYSVGPDARDDDGKPVRLRDLAHWKTSDLVFGMLLASRTVNRQALTDDGG